MSEIEKVETGTFIEPRIRGRFALYDIPDGGIHISWQPDGSDETQHAEIPGKVLKLAKAASEGNLNPMQMAKIMMGGGDV